MGTQPIGGGSTTSFVNTPQAVDDCYSYTEDWLRNSSLYNSLTKRITLDVMANDLGGNAKSLFSIEDGDGNPLTADYDLLCKDVDPSGCSPWEQTNDGNWIRINNGKIEFMIGDGSGDITKARSLDSLAAGECVDDEFVYAIRLANGTLSEATVKIHIVGENDAVTLGAVTDATILDTAADDAFADITGTLTSTDPDMGDAPLYDVAGSVESDEPGYDLEKVTDYGTFYLNSVTGAYKFVADAAAINALDSDDANVLLDFVVSVSDGTTSDSDTLTITLDGANDAPELAAVTDATLTDTAADDTFSNVTGSLAGTDRDDGETLEYGVTGGVASDESGYDLEKVTDYGTFYLNSVTGAYKFVADAAAINALDSDDPNVLLDFVVSVSDGTTSDSDTLTITLDGANDAPELAAVTDATLTDTAADDTFSNVTGSLAGTDRDDGETLEYGVTGGVASDESGYDLEKATDYGTFYLNSVTGAYKFVADAAAINALDSDDPNVLLDFVVSVSDGTTSDSDTLTITLDGANDAPELAAVTDATLTDTAADDTFSNVTGSLAGTDRDDGETLEYGVTGGVASDESGYDLEKVTDYGTFYLNSVTGAYKFVADAAAINALDSDDPNVLLDFVVSVSDGTTSDSDTLTITLDGSNDAPAAAGTNSVTTNEDTVSAAIEIGATDLDGDTLTYSLLGGSEPANGTVDFDQVAGTFTYTPNEDYNGPDSFTILISDGNGGSVEQVVSVTVTSVNDAPAGTTGSVSTLEDTAKTLATADFGFTDPKDDPDNALLTVKIASLPATGTLTLDGSAVSAGQVVSAADIADGKLVYTPPADGTASTSFTFQVQDDGGVLNGGVDLDGSANTLTINITPVNDAPVNTVPGAQTATAGTAKAIAGVSVSDIDSANVSTIVSVLHGSLTVATGTGATLSGNGGASVTISGTQAQVNAAIAALSYTATVGYSGPDTLTVTTSDGALSDVDTIDLTVSAPASAAPTANDDRWVLSDLTALPTGTITAEWFLNNDTDPDSPALFVTDVTNLPPGMTAIYDGAGHLTSITGTTPAAGTFTLTYTMTDGVTFKTATVTMTVVDTDSGTNNLDFNTTYDGTDYSYVDLLSGGDMATGDTTLTGNAGKDVFIGNNGNDVLSGGAGDDSLFGNENTDTLNGGDGNDRLEGGNGTDTLNGGSGNDLLDGGAGNDVLIFNSALNATTNVDAILNFDANNNDKIHLENGIFTQLLATGALNANNFASNAGGNATDGNDYILYDTTTGNLYYDADGNGAGSKTLFADVTLLGGTTLDASDFIVI